RPRDEGLQAGEIVLLSRHHPLLFADFSLRERVERFLRDSASLVGYCFGLLFCNRDAAIVARSTTPMTATDAPALTWTHSLASIFAAVNPGGAGGRGRGFRKR